MYEINRRLPRAHAIVDGAFGLTRTGPMGGDAVKLDWVLVANDLVAADRICVRLMGIDETRLHYLRPFRRHGWWTEIEDVEINTDLAPFRKETFYLARKWTDMPGVACFRHPALAWLGYHSPVAGLAHRILYLFREPLYDYDGERAKVAGRPKDPSH